MNTPQTFLNEAYFPNKDDAEKVTNLVRAGVESKAIANLLGITDKKLKELYPYELGFTDAVELAQVADVALKMALSGEHPSMTKWWLTVKGGWMYLESGPKKEPFQILLDQDIVDEEDSLDGSVVEDAEFYDHE